MIGPVVAIEGYPASCDNAKSNLFVKKHRREPRNPCSRPTFLLTYHSVTGPRRYSRRVPSTLRSAAWTGRIAPGVPYPVRVMPQRQARLLTTGVTSTPSPWNRMRCSLRWLTAVYPSATAAPGRRSARHASRSTGRQPITASSTSSPRAIPTAPSTAQPPPR